LFFKKVDGVVNFFINKSPKLVKEDGFVVKSITFKFILSSASLRLTIVFSSSPNSGKTLLFSE
jgi:hypothetical protein